MEQHEILARIKGMADELPSLPEVTTKLMALLEDPKADASAIVEVIRPDPELSAKVLKVANSAYYGFSQTISSLSRAIPLIGLDTVKSLAMSMGVLDSLGGENETPGFDRQALWLHSLTVSTGLEHLGRELNISTEYLFLLGFLHDIGKLVTAKFFPDEFARCQAEAAADPARPAHEIERAMLGFDHGQVGGLLLKRWKFPKVIVDPVMLHHREELPNGPDAVDVAMLRVVDATAHQAHPSPGQAAEQYQPHDADLRYLEASAGLVDGLRQHLTEQRQAVEDIYAAMR